MLFQGILPLGNEQSTPTSEHKQKSPLTSSCMLMLQMKHNESTFLRHHKNRLEMVRNGYIYIYTHMHIYIYIYIYLHKGKTDWISGLSNCLLWMRICTYQLFFLLQGIQDCPYIQYYIYDIIYIVFLSFQNTWYELHKIGEFTMVGVRKTSRYELKAILVQIMPGLTMTLHTSTGQ